MSIAEFDSRIAPVAPYLTAALRDTLKATGLPDPDDEAALILCHAAALGPETGSGAFRGMSTSRLYLGVIAFGETGFGSPTTARRLAAEVVRRILADPVETKKLAELRAKFQPIELSEGLLLELSMSENVREIVNAARNSRTNELDAISLVTSVLTFKGGRWQQLWASEAIRAAVPRPSPEDHYDVLSKQADRAESPDHDEDRSFGLSGFDLSAGVLAALRYADGLRTGLRQPTSAVSILLLFFALAQSQLGPAPPALSEDGSASLFAGAVGSLAGDRLQTVWDAHFKPGFEVRPIDDKAAEPRLDRRLYEVVQSAELLAAKSNRREIGIDDLMLSFLAIQDGRHVTTLENMGVPVSELRGAYRDAKIGQIGTRLENDVATAEDHLGYASYAKAISAFLLDSATSPPLSISIQAPWGAGKSSLMHQIREILDPKKDRLTSRPKPRETDKPQEMDDRYKPLSLGGVLDFLDQKGPKPPPSEAQYDHIWTVWFNAWKYDTSEQVWAGLVDAIVEQVSDRLSRVDRERFLLQLHLARIDDGIVRRKIYDRIITIWWAQVRRWVIAGSAAIATLFGFHQGVKAVGLSGPDQAFYKMVEWSPYAPLIVLALYMARTYFESRKATRAEPATFSLADYIKVPNYDASLSAIHHIHGDLLRVLATVPVRPAQKKGEHGPLVIFIDDLDRCSPSKVAAVVEGVSMFLASDEYRCMFVIGMDPQMIAAALEHAHSQVRERLPRYERTVPLGWRFMDKFIQLPFTIPPSGANVLDSYVRWLSGARAVKPQETNAAAAPTRPVAQPEQTRRFDRFISPFERLIKGTADALQRSEAKTRPGRFGNAENVAAAARPTPERVLPSASDKEASPDGQAVTKFRESRDVGRIVEEATRHMAGNPREIKRLANLARLYLGLRSAKRKEAESWTSPSVSQYARWIVLTLRWPDMARWLQWGADEVNWPAEFDGLDLCTRRLRILEAAAEQCPSPSRWTAAIVATLGVPGQCEGDWATDPKLCEFFLREVGLDQTLRISAAAAMGFW